MRARSGAPVEAASVAPVCRRSWNRKPTIPTSSIAGNQTRRRKLLRRSQPPSSSAGTSPSRTRGAHPSSSEGGAQVSGRRHEAGKLLAFLGRGREALAYLDRAVTLSPRDPAIRSSRAGARLKGEHLRGLLALMVIAVCAKLAFDLVTTPDDLYTVDVIRRSR